MQDCMLGNWLLILRSEHLVDDVIVIALHSLATVSNEQVANILLHTSKLIFGAAHKLGKTVNNTHLSCSFLVVS